MRYDVKLSSRMGELAQRALNRLGHGLPGLLRTIPLELAIPLLGCLLLIFVDTEPNGITFAALWHWLTGQTPTLVIDPRFR